MSLFPGGSSELEPRVARLEDNYKFIQGLVSGWAGTGTEPYFSFLRARDGFFDRPILETARHRRFISSQAIPNNAWTAVNFNVENYNTGLVIVSTATNSSRVLIAQPGGASENKGMWFSGYANFAANSSGGRGVRINTYSSADVSQGTLPVASIPAAVIATSVPFCSPIRIPPFVTYITLEVFQDSGISLELTEFNLGSLRVF